MRDPERLLKDDATEDTLSRRPVRSGGRGFGSQQPPTREDLVEKGDIWDWIPTLVTFLILYAVLFVFYKPNLLFGLTTTSGGDTGAHHYPAQYLIEYLLPHFKLTGWAPGWYAGMPMLTFYFPFPFLLIAIFNWFLPYMVAFKIVTVLGVFALPWAAYALGRLWRVRRPFPVLAAVFAMIMVFMQSYTIYGGNILSTLAGEFSFMLSFALVFLWLGTMYRGMENPKFNMFFVLNCLILMALVISHIVPTIALVLMAPGLLLVHPRWRSLGYLAAVAAIGFLLTAFWTLPFIIDLKWTAHMAWDQLGWEGLGGWWLLPAGVPAVMGVLFAAFKREKKLLPLLWMSVVIVVAYWLLPSGRLWNARVVPFWYMSVHLWAAYGITWLVRPFSVWFSDLFGVFGATRKTGRRFFVPVTALAFMLVVTLTSHTASGWISWNYKGYEGKEGWSQYQEINNYLKTLGTGRVMVEHNQKIDKLGTPRAFEIIPYWTNMQTMEGTLMEASFTAPFHFINQAELSKEASNAIIGVDYPTLNVANGITHMQLMNIEYFLTCTEEITSDTKADPRAQLLATFGDYNIFRISGTMGYAEVMQNQPVKIDIAQPDWRDVAVRWYENMDDLETPIIWDTGDPALKDFATITSDQAENPPQVPYQTEGHVISETLENESFTFDVNQAAVGKPVWIKISYFPNWHVSGAKGPFLASPSFMMVIPTQTHVVMTYGRTPANTVGQTFEVIGWVILIGLSVWCFVLWRRRRRLAGAGASGTMPVDEFTGQYLDGEERYEEQPEAWVVPPPVDSAPYDDDLDQTADRPAAECAPSEEGVPEGGYAPEGRGEAGSWEPDAEPDATEAEAREALARYETGDRGSGVPGDDSVEGEADPGRED